MIAFSGVVLNVS